MKTKFFDAITAQLPTLPSGAIENWLLSATAVMAIAVLARRVLARRAPEDEEFVTKAEFRLFRESAERELNGLRDKIDARFLTLGERIEAMKSELLAAGERRDGSLHHRLNDLEAGLARVDERTRK
jgi:hypothetical protein